MGEIIYTDIKYSVRTCSFVKSFNTKFLNSLSTLCLFSKMDKINGIISMTGSLACDMSVK